MDSAYALAGGVDDVVEGVEGVVDTVVDNDGVSVVEGGVDTVVNGDVDAVVGSGVEDVVEAVVDTGAAGPPPPPQADNVPAMLRIAVSRRVRLKFRFTVISRQR